MREFAFSPLNGDQIRPEGWLKKQMELQADGLVGHLDQIWPEVRDSKWIGGNNDGWERFPYWLDGFVPLAWLLDRKDFQQRVHRYIDYILKHQAPEGWICPCPLSAAASYDVWACFLMLKVLTQYADLTRRDDVEDAVARALAHLNRHIDLVGIHRWALARWYECLIPIYWLYARRPEQWLIDMANKLRALGADYRLLMETQPIDVPESHWSMWRHVVNLAMYIKKSALTYPLTGEDVTKEAHAFLDAVMKDNGMCIGHFSGDECLAGSTSNSGTELCGVAEAMYSYEWLLRASGDVEWADAAEYLAFNAYASTVSADMWSHQYLQMPNQVRCVSFSEEDNPFRTNSGCSHVYGLEPNDGCCTANMAQAWPKLAQSAFLRTENTLVSALLVPSQMTTNIDGAAVRVTLQTLYPFRDTLRYEIETDKPVSFAFKIRIPGFAKSAAVDGGDVACGAFHTIERVWDGKTVVNVALQFAPILIDRPYGLRALRIGPLLYSLPLSETWTRVEYEKGGVERKYPHCDYEVSTEDSFGFGFAGDAGEAEVHWSPMGDLPFGGQAPAIWVTMPMAPVAWELRHGKSEPLPVSGVPTGEPRPMRLIPYGCARLRMTEMPLCTK